MKRFVGIVGLGCVLAGTAGAESLKMNEQEVLRVLVGESGLTRISVRGSRVAHVFTSPAEAASHVEHHESGNVFVAPEGVMEPISVSVVTEEGETQDLALVPTKGRKSRPIVLERAKKELRPDAKSAKRKKEERVREVLKVFEAGGIAPGFVEKEGFEGERRKLLEGELIEVRRFEGGELCVRFFEGVVGDKETEEKRVLKVKPEAVTRGSDVAVVMTVGEVEEGGVIKAVVIGERV